MRRETVVIGAMLSMTILLGGAARAAAADVDGTYVGNMTLLKGSPTRCPAGRTITVVVKDGKVPVSWRKEPAEAVVQSDGTFTASVGGAQSAVKISGDKLENDIGDSGCTYNWSLKRQP